MGTTTTTNLGLIKPDVDEKIMEDLPTYAGWADQNADNMDNVDRLFRFTNTTYVPVLTPGGGSFTLGASGTLTGKYMRVKPGLVYGHITGYMGGAGFSAGTGDYSITLPLAVASALALLSDTVPIGSGILYDDTSVLNSTRLGVYYFVSTGQIKCKTQAGAAFGATSPFTIAQQDRFTLNFLYPTSVA